MRSVSTCGICSRPGIPRAGWASSCRPRALDGFRVRSRGGKLKVTDGPFSESKEIVGGYALVDVSSKEEALNVAREFMELHRVHWPSFDGECEARPLEDM